MEQASMGGRVWTIRRERRPDAGWYGVALSTSDAWVRNMGTKPYPHMSKSTSRKRYRTHQEEQQVVCKW